MIQNKKKLDELKKKKINEIAAQILPNGKKPRLPKKVKDTEGLGMKIPLGRIGEIAGTVASGALTGGLTLAGEALATGGLGALTTDAIAGSMIGGGVGAGVNSTLAPFGDNLRPFFEGKIK